MEVRIIKLRVALAALFVLAGVGLGSLLSPLVSTALATAGSTVNISDKSSSPYFAKVDSAGKLYVGDGSGPLTVDGTVSGRPAAPASPWSASEDIEFGIKLLAGPSAVPIDVTSLSISTDTTSGDNLHVFLYGRTVPSSATSCTSTTGDLTLWHIRDLEPIPVGPRGSPFARR